MKKLPIDDRISFQPKLNFKKFKFIFNQSYTNNRFANSKGENINVINKVLQLIRKNEMN